MMIDAPLAISCHECRNELLVILNEVSHNDPPDDLIQSPRFIHFPQSPHFWPSSKCCVLLLGDEVSGDNGKVSRKIGRGKRRGGVLN